MSGNNEDSSASPAIPSDILALSSKIDNLVTEKEFLCARHSPSGSCDSCLFSSFC